MTHHTTEIHIAPGENRNQLQFVTKHKDMVVLYMDSFIENVYIALSCLVLLISILFLTLVACFDVFDLSQNKQITQKLCDIKYTAQHTVPD